MVMESMKTSMATVSHQWSAKNKAMKLEHLEMGNYTSKGVEYNRVVLVWGR